MYKRKADLLNLYTNLLLYVYNILFTSSTVAREEVRSSYTSFRTKAISSHALINYSPPPLLNIES